MDICGFGWLFSLEYAALRELEGANLERFQTAQHNVSGFDAIRWAVAATSGGNADETYVWIAFLSRAIAKIIRDSFGDSTNDCSCD